MPKVGRIAHWKYAQPQCGIQTNKKVWVQTIGLGFLIFMRPRNFIVHNYCYEF